MDSKQNKALIGIVVLVIIAVVVVAAVMLNKPSTDNAVASPSSSVAGIGDSSTPSSSAGDSTSTYKDGTYTATGSYSSPGGTEKITVTVTLKDSAITSTSAVSGAIDQEGKEFQSRFISGYPTLVVGKKVSEVNLSRVSGSSLTSQGFNSALTQIKSQAQG